MEKGPVYLINSIFMFIPVKPLLPRYKQLNTTPKLSLLAQIEEKSR